MPMRGEEIRNVDWVAFVRGWSLKALRRVANRPLMETREGDRATPRSVAPFRALHRHQRRRSRQPLQLGPAVGRR
jgi:hypothetical protein